MRRLFLAALLALAALPAFAQLAEMKLKVGTHAVTAEVANTDDARMTGLMHRKTMPESHGMLFVFERAGFQAMWMQNTYIPLSVAFIDHQGRILNIADMKPLTTDSHASAGLAKYALEMNLGWFAKRGIKAGMRIEGLDQAPAPK